MTLNADLVRARCGDIEEALRRLQRFGSLQDAGVIGADLASRLQAMARFRNLLVHMYARVDPARVHAIIRENSPDLHEFAKSAARLLA